MKIVWTSIILLAIVLCSTALAQDADVARMKEAALANTFGTRPAATPYALIDMSKLSFSHSYSMSFLSGGSGSGSVGMWNTAMLYEFSPKLSLTMDLGVMHSGGAMSGPSQNDATFLPGFLLDYHPSDKFSLKIGMSRVNPYYYPNHFRSTGFDRYDWLRTGD